MSQDGSQRPDASAFASARPEADLEGRLVLEAMRGALFGQRSKPVSVGRYELIERLGSGALGLVVAAHDPELDRRVAIKLLPARVDSRKLLREARALARLSSPHVVAVLDVGTFEPEDIGTLFSGDAGDPAGTGIWLAMELIEGVSLDAWINKGPHAWREVLDVFVEAGAGLADAHDARIVHRDFKPANVILGNDKRVRVVDFGLARSPNLSFMTSADADAAADDAALLRGLIGTPAYMSPEQHKGEPTDERADQFSFCVSLFEALYGDLPYPGPRYEDFMRGKNEGPPPMPAEPPVPLPIQRALTRGLQPEPGQRFESMRALLAALTWTEEAHGKSSGRLVAGGLLLAGVVGATYLMLATRNDCALPEADSARWDGVRRTLVAEVSGADAPYAKVAAFRVQEVLAAREAAWTQTRDQVCQAESLSTASEQCLVVAMRGMDAATDRLTQMVPSRLDALESVLELVPDARTCAASPPPAQDDGATKAVDLRHRLFVARLQARGGDPAGGLAASKAARQAATDLGFAPLSAEAAFVQGENEWVSLEPVLAQATLADAYQRAIDASYPRLAAQAAADLVRLTPPTDEAAANAWMDKALTALGDTGGVLAVDVRLARAYALASHEKWGEAITEFELARALAEANERSVPPAWMARLYGGLADALLAKGRADEANAMAERALSLVESAFGPGHPQLASALTRAGRIALSRGRMQDAENRLRRALELRDGGAPGTPQQQGDLLVALANVVSEQGDHDEARRLLERAVVVYGTTGPRVQTLQALCRVLQGQGDLTAARSRCEEAMAALRPLDPVDDEAMLSLETRLGEILLAQGELDAADAQFSSGLARAEKRFGPGHPRAAPLLIAMAELRHEQGRTDDAVALLDRVAALSATLGPADHDVVMAIVRRAWLMAEAGKGQAALDAVREQRSKADESLAPVDRLELVFAEAGALWSVGQRDEAVTTARQARQIYARTEAAKAAPLARVDAWLAAR